MPIPEYETTPSEVRNFALLQIGLTTVFLVVLFLAFGGTGKDFPPIWLDVVLLIPTAVAAFLAERVWLSVSPLDPDDDPEALQARAVGIFAGQVVRKLVYCEAAVVIAIVVGFVTQYGGWPMLIGGVPALLLLAFETWPGARNASMTEVMLNADGAETQLVESFREW